jgi:hypothetical protein
VVLRWVGIESKVSPENNRVGERSVGKVEEILPTATLWSMGTLSVDARPMKTGGIGDEE